MESCSLPTQTNFHPILSPGTHKQTPASLGTQHLAVHKPIFFPHSSERAQSLWVAWRSGQGSGAPKLPTSLYILKAYSLCRGSRLWVRSPLWPHRTFFLLYFIAPFFRLVLMLSFLLNWLPGWKEEWWIKCMKCVLCVCVVCVCCVCVLCVCVVCVCCVCVLCVCVCV
ncbi:hypothetical protein QBC32DRAFT_150882 [Pseudoneurospora amorphoporcata]|uniref:Uncharacterized protein n=1 Tax=Pseudoneurospora amorphoporcata TaxID=241081 RepID=A0AAN6SGE2_9PEZI|nr:hypothetical protein QBC32DRAFT_150882 [Pseudoneurospora amorphoporcata]